MKTQTLTAIALTLFAACIAQAANSPAPAQATAPSVPTLRVVVDPRVELLSLVFRLAGNPEYNQARVESYAADAEKQFTKFQEHQAIQLASKLRKTRGVSYDACMSMAVHLTDVDSLQTRLPLEPWPEALDQRWTVSSAREFLEAARDFVQDTAFKDFLAQHQPLY
ncbi:MAG TPA: DUF4932 domain-containing protein, partial [Candidatus Sulfotelmatobacter sp.]|nr:DUF4932 domain-containing protein [Candidatus Sulfotelmatobacter sp.]